MRKLAVSLIIFVLTVGLALPALAGEIGGYHQVYEYDPVVGWVLTDKCEMFSKTSNVEQYRWQSAPLAEPCYVGPYLPPEPEAPIQKTMKNFAHLFPWIEIHFNETVLVWDIFKPGDYMAKAFIIQLKSNGPVQVHLGAGTFSYPASFDPGPEEGQDGKILFKEEEKLGDDVAFCEKVRQYSLLCKDETTSPGTPPDLIDVRWWWYQSAVKPDPHLISPEEFAKMPDKDEWVPCRDVNSTLIIVPDSEQLHEYPYGWNIVFFEDLLVEQCDSEGKYYEEFVITICPDA